jgi:hypothetical protein
MPFFPDVSKIRFEGPDSRNPLAYRHYNPDELVERKPMRDHRRFIGCYWHSSRGTVSEVVAPVRAVHQCVKSTDSHETTFICSSEREAALCGEVRVVRPSNACHCELLFKEVQQCTRADRLSGSLPSTNCLIPCRGERTAVGGHDASAHLDRKEVDATARNADRRNVLSTSFRSERRAL